ncbi:Acg family FMN-binding oxidoreductase [Streptomyces virginiae]|uniref:Acg family FMN-binding oxidoreductase n=1 Tax=Streptomyces virginiae TaxID=1961 RepID=UPI003244E70B
MRHVDPGRVTGLVEDATAAPSMHNAQPWRFRWLSKRHVLELRADTARAMPHADPDNRALHLGCGAALFNLRVSAAHAGLEPVCRLLPDPAEGLLVATVRLDEPVVASAVLSALRPAIRRRHTSREPFTEQEIPETVWRELREAARAEGAGLGVPDAWHTQSILELVQDAEGRDSLEPANSEEMEGWIRTGPAASLSADGVPEYAFGPFRHDGRAPVRDFAGRHRVADRPAATFESAPRLVLLGTAEDGPADWLRAGQAMERVLLVATSHGLATSLTSHALERPDLRWNVRDPLTAMGHVQMVLRLGYGPGGVRSPRRPVGEVLDFV